MNPMETVGRLLALPFVGLVWVVSTGPQLAWARLYPALQAKGKHRAVWLPWVVIVSYLIIDAYLHYMAHKPGAGAVAHKLEELRVLLARGVDSVLFVVPRWAFAATKDNPALGTLVVLALTVGGLFLASFVLLAPLWVYLGAPKPSRGHGDSHGTAFWGSAEHAARSGLLLRKGAAGGLMLGRFAKAPRGFDARLRTTRHVLTCAPTRSGKGVG